MLLAANSGIAPLEHAGARHQSSHGGVDLLHVVGPVTDEVFSFLGPATRALAKHGHVQHIVLVDSPDHQHNVRQLEGYSTIVRVKKVANPFSQWLRVHDACKKECANNRPNAVHAHGLIPVLLLSSGIRMSASKIPLVYSLHGSRPLGTLRVAGKLAILAARPVRSSAIVTTSREADAFNKRAAADVVESPVQEIFFSGHRREASKPLIVTGSRTGSARSVEVFSQLAVLLGDKELGLEFHWLGSVEDAARQRLRAAGVSISPIVSDAERAAFIAAGWMYVAPWAARGFPLFLVQAMAAGLPCVALDCEQHREVVEDGVNGYLCATEQEMVRTIAALVDDSVLRARIGAAARASAHTRFSESTFDDKLLNVYATLW